MRLHSGASDIKPMPNPRSPIPDPQFASAWTIYTSNWSWDACKCSEAHLQLQLQVDLDMTVDVDVDVARSLPGRGLFVLCAAIVVHYLPLPSTYPRQMLL